MENFDNPLTFPSISDLLVAVLNVMIVIATPIVVFFIIYAGFMYVTAKGKAEQIQQASRALTYGVIGGVIIIGSIAITQIVQNVVNSF
ncbi:hypothetical protein H6781_01900 [Candidatus Nomurabacteria bacterium]|nr:hypothetical protein [Candidatus Kaiserbacteria bacterium]MCB9810327.1 hypothetical protein [Candidatus Nomurabacteria bacterium]MCB9818464.1 hypothetical protein [Candidatus Nomurabacteria bacterium]